MSESQKRVIVDGAGNAALVAALAAHEEGADVLVLEGGWARLRHLGARHHELLVRATAARQRLPGPA